MIFLERQRHPERVTVAEKTLAPYNGAMSNGFGDEARGAFLEMLAEMGADYDVRGETRRALKQTKKKEGFIVLQFADEFAVDAGDRIRESRTELQFDVVDSEAQTNGGVMTYFEVTTERGS